MLQYPSEFEAFRMEAHAIIGDSASSDANLSESISASPVRLAQNILLQNPLSRRGKGPGLLLITSDKYDDRKEQPIRKTLDPEPLQKWAEEGFVVVEVKVSGGQTDLIATLTTAIQTLKLSPGCTNPDKLGVIGMFRILVCSNAYGHVH